MNSTSLKKTLAPENEKGAVWLARPFQLVSPHDMQRFYGERFWRLSKTLESMASVININPKHPSVESPLQDETVETLSSHLDRVREHCLAVGLEFSLLQIDRMKRGVLNKCIFKDYINMVRVLQERIEDEMSLSLFFHVPKDKAAFYEKIDPFGDLVTANFAAATFDIEEANRCFATGHNTACVMHLMRALEVALDAVGLGVGVPNTVVEAQNSWERLLRRISDQITANDNSGDVTWPPKRQFFVDSSAHLFAVKNAWRNPSMHLEKKYDDSEAERIYRAVQDFMAHLATHLNESGQFTP